MPTGNKEIPTKELLTDEALKYDEKENGEYIVTPSQAFAKGLRRGISISIPYLQDYFKNTIEKLIK